MNCARSLFRRGIVSSNMLSCVVAITATMLFFVADRTHAQDLGDRINAHLDAGEFGVARELARAADNITIRDRWLGDVAAAQAIRGARRASVDTASLIDSDLSRSRVLSDIGTGPLGPGAGGGAAAADFDSLIELITTTVAPESWDEVGGPGTIDSFEGGVYVDGAGVLKLVLADSGSESLATVRNRAAASTGNTDVRKRSRLRKVSLNRLEKQVQLRQALGEDPDDIMKSMAGIYEIKYVLIYPDTGDVVIAGPADDWTINAEGRKVSASTGKPVLNLDDLVVCLRNAFTEGSRFGCSITPRKENLAATQRFLAESRLKGEAWRTKLRETLGKQDIEVYGVDPRSRVARVMVEADYRMKLVGMGLEDATAGVSSYLDMVELGADGKPPATDVVRWWFALNYDALTTVDSRDAFELRGQGVKVLSETELLTERGERVHTGKSDGPTREFAHSFTREFGKLAAKYPIYAELKNVFDLSLVAALLKAEDVPGQVGWHMTHFLGGENDLAYQIEYGLAAKEVDTIMNHRTVRAKRVIHTVVGVSGGVAVDTNQLVRRDKIKADTYGLMSADRRVSAPKTLPRDAWWWD